jgi:hypothetical protein
MAWHAMLARLDPALMNAVAPTHHVDPSRRSHILHQLLEHPGLQRLNREV